MHWDLLQNIDKESHTRTWVTPPPKQLHHCNVPPHHRWWPHGNRIMESCFQPTVHFLCSLTSPKVTCIQLESQSRASWPSLGKTWLPLYCSILVGIAVGHSPGWHLALIKGKAPYNKLIKRKWLSPIKRMNSTSGLQWRRDSLAYSKD